MIAHLRPAGAVLAGVAAWSVGLLVLSLGGLGGRVGPHEGNAALAPPVPEVRLEAVDSRLGPAADYAEVGNRPLLSPDRRPAPVSDAEGSGAAPLDAELTSVLIAGELKLAILQGTSDGSNRRVRLGDLVEGTAWRLVEVEPRRAVFEGPEGRRELVLRVFNGTGGEPVTQVAAPAGAPIPAPRPVPGAAPVAAPPAAEPGAVAPAASDATAQAAPISPEQQVEAIRRRIEARRAQRAAEAAAERSAQDGAKQVE